jgi:hypothetical protein
MAVSLILGRKPEYLEKNDLAQATDKLYSVVSCTSCDELDSNGTEIQYVFLGWLIFIYVMQQT